MAVVLDPEEIKLRLRSVPNAGYSRDIVSSGFVRGIEFDHGTLRIDFTPDTGREDRIEQMVRGIQEALEGMLGIQEVCVNHVRPQIDPVLTVAGPETAAATPGKGDGRRTMSPLQAELLEDGIAPEPDPLAGGPSLRRPDLAPGAGYHEGGPNPLDGPRLDPPAGAAGADGSRYTGPVRVFQWDIDPTNVEAVSGQAVVALDGWEYNLWWQVHPQRLVFTSIQAVYEDVNEERPGARRHPVGRAVAVNLVYDLERCAIIAIYGTARDFRPFVEAFRQGYGLQAADGEAAPVSESGVDNEEAS